MEPTLDYVQAVRKDHWKNLAWSNEETTFKNRALRRNDVLEESIVDFSSTADIKLRKSFLGTYLEVFNYQQNQDKFLNENKFGITQFDLKQLSPEEREALDGKNNMTDDVYALLESAVKYQSVIDCNFLYNNLRTLRLVDCDINVIDESLTKFRFLSVLILTANWITEIPGKFLPGTLKFLELFCNEIADVEAFCEDGPKMLLHLGLNRNQLTDDSRLHLLASSSSYRYLRTLDLGDNDICNLVAVLQGLKQLPTLHSLSLQGNPCSTCICYKDTVLAHLPHLSYLDATEILEKDRQIGDYQQDETNKALVVFTCHRIIGLPAPAKEKGVMQTFHLELSLPLLEEIKQDIPGEDDDDDDQEEQQTPKAKGKGKVKSGGKDSDKNAKLGKGQKGKYNPYAGPDEYEAERKAKIKDRSFKTDRVAWSKVIQFPEEALLVEPPDCDLKSVRDTFRSAVNVKLVYLKWLPPSKKGVSKKGGKGKTEKDSKKNAKEKSDKSSKKGKDSKDKQKPKSKGAESVEKNKQEKEPKETILKKLTLANFSCDLHQVNWSNKTIDYYWAAHPDLGLKAVAVEGDLRAAIQYVESKKKEKTGGKKQNNKKENKNGKGEKQEVEIEMDGDALPVTKKIPSHQFLPEILTCQVGFGLKRSYAT